MDTAEQDVQKPKATEPTDSRTDTDDGSINAKEIQKKLRTTIISVSLLYVIPFTYISSTMLPSIFFLIELRDTHDLDLSLAGAFLSLNYLFRMIALATCIRAPRLFAIVGSILGLLGFGTIAMWPDNIFVFVAGNLVVGCAEIMGALQTFVKDYYSHHSVFVVGHNLKLQYSVTTAGIIASFFIGGFIYDYFDVRGVAIFGILLFVTQIIFLNVFVVLEHQEEGERDQKGFMWGDEAEKSTSVKLDKLIEQAIAEDEALDEGDALDLERGSAPDLLQGQSSSSMKNSIRFGEISETKNVLDVLPGDDEDLDLVTVDHSRISKEIHEDEEFSENEENNEIHSRESPENTNAMSVKDSQRRSSISSIYNMFHRGCKNSGKNIKRPTDMINRYAFLEELPIAWINYLVAVAVAFQSIMNGFIFGTGSLLMFEEFELSKSIIGIIYSISSVSGSVSSALTLNQKFVDGLKRFFPSPNNFYFCLAGTSLMVSLTAVPSFVVYLTGFILMNSFLVMFISFLTELQGKICTKSNYKKLSPASQIIRRAFGLVIAYAAPALYGVSPRLPNVVGGATSFAFLSIIVVGFETRKRQAISALESELGASSLHITRQGITIAKENGRRRLTFSDQIVITNMIAHENECVPTSVVFSPSIPI